MPFPKFKHCLICDNAREEVRGKVTLIGFLGVSPDVEILVPDPPNGGALQLSFVFVGGAGGGTFPITYELFDVKQGVPLGKIDPGKPTDVVQGIRTTMILGLTGVYPHFGRYELRMFVAGKLEFAASFEISKLP